MALGELGLFCIIWSLLACELGDIGVVDGGEGFGNFWKYLEKSRWFFADRVFEIGFVVHKRAWVCGNLGGIGGLSEGKSEKFLEKCGIFWKNPGSAGFDLLRLTRIHGGAGVRNWVCFA